MARSNFKDLTGQRFGRWVVVERQPNSKNGSARWKVKCDCGNESTVYGFTLRNGETKSCGCLNAELASKRQQINPTCLLTKTHGMSNTPFYKKYAAMRGRCSSDRSYKGKIFVCDRWKIFENFKEDMYESYLEHVALHGEHNTSLERIDGYGNYEPSNCKWVTLKEQLSHQDRKKVRVQAKDNKAGV